MSRPADDGSPSSWSRVASAWLRQPGLAAGVLAGSALLVVLQRRVDLVWTPMPLAAVVAALLTTLLLRRQVPVLVAALWGLGALSLVWSLAPGDTLLALLWWLLLPAAAAVGRFRWALLAVLTYVLLDALASALALNLFQQARYFSGSVHYLLGARAIAVLPPALVIFAVARRRVVSALAWSLAVLAAYGVLMSGSRGVYLAALVVTTALAARTLSARPSRRRMIVGLVALAVAVTAIDLAIPSHPVAEAFGQKATLQAQETSLADSGGFSQRVRFWRQGLAMARAHPLGVGLGGFRSTVHAYQLFPMVWSSSPHNVFVETAATLGWAGLALLLLLLGYAFVRAWRSSAWAWGLALIGVWGTLSVDVTADYPRILVIAFALIGACLGPTPGRTTGRGAVTRTREGPRPPAPRWASAAAVALILAGTALAAWWYLPCNGPQCALTRWRGVPYRVAEALPQLAAGDRATFLARLERLYPRSLWVLEYEEKYATGAGERVAIARRIATTYPLQSWRNYLTWAELSLAVHDVEEAKRAVRKGLEVFGPDSTRYPGWRTDPEGYRAWLQRAQQILAMTP